MPQAFQARKFFIPKTDPKQEVYKPVPYYFGTDYRTGILAFLYHTERGTTVLAAGREDFVAQGNDTRDAGGGRGRFRF